MTNPTGLSNPEIEWLCERMSMIAGELRGLPHVKQSCKEAAALIRKLAAEIAEHDAITAQQNALIRRLSSEADGLREALTDIADERSPHDETGEPLQVRIANDLSRRIDLARAALAGGEKP